MAVVAAFGSLVIVGASTLTAYTAGSSGTPGGDDVSYPQCSVSLPAPHTFGIVGVNEGLANNTNPCLAGEVTWARNSPGRTKQARVAFMSIPRTRAIAMWLTGRPVTATR
jgi:hypothetical protein